MKQKIKYSSGTISLYHVVKLVFMLTFVRGPTSNDTMGWGHIFFSVCLSVNIFLAFFSCHESFKSIQCLSFLDHCKGATASRMSRQMGGRLGSNQKRREYNKSKAWGPTMQCFSVSTMMPFKSTDFGIHYKSPKTNELVTGWLVVRDILSPRSLLWLTFDAWLSNRKLLTSQGRGRCVAIYICIYI